MLVLAGVAAANSGTLDRPDVTLWPTVGFTVRASAEQPKIPAQFRQVQIDPDSYRRLLADGRYPDGTRFAVQFHGVQQETAHSPPLYHATKEVAFALEVIDRAHPDGRRFYMYAPGAQSASPLPPGNECAMCHRAQGSFDGTFVQLYPALARFAAKPAKP